MFYLINLFLHQFDPSLVLVKVTDFKKMNKYSTRDIQGHKIQNRWII